MTTPHKTKIFGSVNLALMEPLETLSAERLKLLSKEEIRAYLHYYDVDISNSNIKNDLKSQLKNLIASIHDGSVPRRPGIGSDIKRTSSGAPSSEPGSKLIDTASHKVATALPHIATTRPPSPISPATARTSSTHPTHTSVSGGKSGPDPFLSTDRPPILDEDLELNVQDVSYPMSVAKFEQQYPTVAPLMYRYHHSFVDRLEHLQPSSRAYLHRGTTPQTTSVYTSELACIVCGKRSLRECRFRRCRNCCALQGAECEVHRLGRSPGAFSSRPLDRSGAPASLASAQSGLPKHVRRNAPPPIKPIHVVVGPMESEAPTTDLRDEALHRSIQNAQCIETIFDAQSIDSINNSMQTWHSKSLHSLNANLEQLQSDLMLVESTHQERIQRWIDRSAKFEARLAAIHDYALDEQAQWALRKEWLEEIDYQLPVPLVARKRSANDLCADNLPESKRVAMT